MNNAPLLLAITLMDFDKFMLSVTDPGAAPFCFLAAHYEDRRVTRSKMDTGFGSNIASNVYD